MTKDSDYVKFGNMFKRLILIIFIILVLLGPSSLSFAFWMWTPETGEWVNPKFAVKDTPGEQLKYGMDFLVNKKYKEAIRELEK